VIIADQAAINVGFASDGTPWRPTPAKPKSIVAHVEARYDLLAIRPRLPRGAGAPVLARPAVPGPRDQLDRIPARLYDLSYFNRTFRRFYGATPSDVREAMFSGDGNRLGPAQAYSILDRVGQMSANPIPDRQRTVCGMQGGSE
jgi:hypothetical protein